MQSSLSFVPLQAAILRRSLRRVSSCFLRRSLLRVSSCQAGAACCTTINNRFYSCSADFTVKDNTCVYTIYKSPADRQSAASPLSLYECTAERIYIYVLSPWLTTDNVVFNLMSNYHCLASPSQGSPVPPVGLLIVQSRAT